MFYEGHKMIAEGLELMAKGFRSLAAAEVEHGTVPEVSEKQPPETAKKTVNSEPGIPAPAADPAPQHKRRGRPSKAAAAAKEADESVPEKVAAPSPAPKNAKNPVGAPPVASKKKPPVDPEPEEDDEDDSGDEVTRLVNSAVEGMSNEDIADILTSAGVNPSGKREAMIAKVIKAVHDKLIVLNEDDEDGEAEDADDEIEIDADAQEDVDAENEVDFSELGDMTDERREAVEKHYAKIGKAFKAGKLNRVKLVDWLEQYFGDDDNDFITEMSDEELFENYKRLSALYFNDSGEEVSEEGAYTVNDVPFCCGRPLAYFDEDSKYVCEACGQEYEAE